ncbi:MAG: helix-turn-helix domain-containing protein [Rhizobiaceae bacterium]|nr:helix-turn-helix domain-containing protein [Rhizobiaceae bacterium]
MAPDQLSGVASGVLLEIDVLSPGGGTTLSRRFQGDAGWTIDATELGCHVRANGAMPTGSVAIVAIENPADAAICRIPLQEATVMVIPSGVDLAAAVRPGLRYVAAVVPLACWLDVAAAVTGRDPTPPLRSMTAQLPPGPGARAANATETLITRITAEAGHQGAFPAGLSDYLATVVDTIEQQADSRTTPTLPLSRRVRQAWAAHDFVTAHLADAITVPQLCLEVGASRRQLEYALREVFGLSPHGLIERARLNACRRALQGARAQGRSVTQVAMDLGVTHLGRFAAQYRLLFGERPSETYRGAGTRQAGGVPF